jgi:hypothetical protein
VKLFQRNILVRAFRLPLWGHQSDETPPQWLIRRMQTGELAMNSLGGFTMTTPFGLQSCAGGDVVILTEDDVIQFARPDEFEKFEPVTSSEDLLAA